MVKSGLNFIQNKMENKTFKSMEEFNKYFFPNDYKLHPIRIRANKEEEEIINNLRGIPKWK